MDKKELENIMIQIVGDEYEDGYILYKNIAQLEDDMINSFDYDFNKEDFRYMWNLYNEFHDMGPEGFYEEYHNIYNFSDDFKSEYGTDEDFEESLEEGMIRYRVTFMSKDGWEKWVEEYTIPEGEDISNYIEESDEYKVIDIDPGTAIEESLNESVKKIDGVTYYFHNLPDNANLLELYAVPYRSNEDEESYEETDHLVLYELNGRYGYSTESLGSNYGFSSANKAYDYFINEMETSNDWLESYDIRFIKNFIIHPDDDNYFNESNQLKDMQTKHRRKQKGKSPFVKLDAGDVEYNTNAFNRAMGEELKKTVLDGKPGDKVKNSKGEEFEIVKIYQIDNYDYAQVRDKEGKIIKLGLFKGGKYNINEYTLIEKDINEGVAKDYYGDYYITISPSNQKKLMNMDILEYGKFKKAIFANFKEIRAVYSDVMNLKYQPEEKDELIQLSKDINEFIKNYNTKPIQEELTPETASKEEMLADMEKQGYQIQTLDELIKSEEEIGAIEESDLEHLRDLRTKGFNLNLYNDSMARSWIFKDIDDMILFFKKGARLPMNSFWQTFASEEADKYKGLKEDIKSDEEVQQKLAKEDAEVVKENNTSITYEIKQPKQIIIRNELNELDKKDFRDLVGMYDALELDLTMDEKKQIASLLAQDEEGKVETFINQLWYKYMEAPNPDAIDLGTFTFKDDLVEEDLIYDKKAADEYKDRFDVASKEECEKAFGQKVIDPDEEQESDEERIERLENKAEEYYQQANQARDDGNEEGYDYYKDYADELMREVDMIKASRG